jgi:Mg-chelatase subunit ChlD
MDSTFVRRIAAGAGIICVAVLMGFSGLALLSPRKVATGPLSRAVPQRIAGVGSRLSVTVEIAPEAVPDYQSAPTSPPADVVLVVDRSGSMQGQPFEQALAGARSFVERSDLSRHQVALVFFNSQAETVQGLTQEADALESSMQGVYATDGTSIHEALRAARQELGSEAHRTGSQPLIVLFSDGGSDAGLAEREADAAKADGVRIVVIGLRGTSFNPDLLSRIASSASDLIVAADPTALQALFITVAQQINRTTATGFVIEERFDVNRFDVWNDSPVPGAELGSGYLRWGPTVFTDAGAVVSYQLRPLAIGWHSVATGDGIVTMTDYLGHELEYAQAGPRILVVPAPGPWCLLPLLLLLPPLVLFVHRRVSMGSHPSGATPVATTRVFDRVPPDISRLVAGVGPLDPGVVEAVSFPPTLIVGVGDIGAWALTHIKKNLADRCEGKMPDGVRLLSIDIMEPNVGDPVTVGDVSLASEEQLHLTPDFDEIRRSLARRDPPHHLRWWHDTGGASAEGRASSRMALFWDVLALSGESRLIHALHDALGALGGPRVFIVASLGDHMGSAISWDLAYLLRWIQKDRGKDLRRVVFWLALPAEGETIEARAVGARRFAAMRELARLTFQEDQPYDFGAGLSGVNRGSPVDQCVIFDAEAEDEAVPLEDASLRHGLLVAMADALSTVLDTQVHRPFEGELTRSSKESTRKQREIGQCLVTSLGCFEYKLPIEDIRRTAEARFLLDLLFSRPSGGEGGLLRVLGGDSSTPQLDTDQKPSSSEAREAALHFLRSTSLQNHHEMFVALGDITRRQGKPPIQQLAERPSNPVDVFRWRLQEHLTALLNGSGEDYVSARSGRLLFVLEMLRALDDILGGEKPSPQISQGLPEGWITQTRQAQEEVESWLAALVGKSQGSASTSLHIRRPSAPQRAHDGDPTLFSLVSDDWQNRRTALAEQASLSPTRRLMLEPGASEPPYDGLEASYYRRHMRPEVTREVSGARRPLNRMMQRLLWYWDEEGGASRLKMLVLPVDFDSTRSDWRSHLYGPEDIGRIHDALRGLSRVFSRGIRTNEWIAPLLRDEGTTHVADQLMKGEKPLLRYDRARAVQETQLPQDTELFLVGPESTLLDSLAEEMVHVKPACIVSGDAHTCVLLGLRSFIPLDLLDTYLQDEQDYHLDPALHVFSAEQTAVRFERKRRQRGERRPRFQPLFVRLLENEDLARLFGLACIYGWVRMEHDDRGLPAWLLRTTEPSLSIELTKGRDKTLLDAMEAFALVLPLTVKEETHPLFSRNLEGTRKTLNRALSVARQTASAERLGAYRAFETSTVKQLEDGTDRLERDLAVLLAVLLEEERLM